MEGPTTMTRFVFRDHRAGERLDVTAIVQRAGKLSPTQHAVLRALVSRVRAGTTQLPDANELSARLGSRSDVCRRALKQLADAGIIVLEEDPPNCN
jgi:DNA-binding MarR family transcriptional regulator